MGPLLDCRRFYYIKTDETGALRGSDVRSDVEGSVLQSYKLPGNSFFGVPGLPWAQVLPRCDIQKSPTFRDMVERKEGL